MGLLIAEFLGQAFGLAAISYPFSVWGAKHPLSTTPLNGLKWLLFCRMFVFAVVITLTQNIINSMAPTDMWAVVALIICIGIGRILRERMIKEKFR